MSVSSELYKKKENQMAGRFFNRIGQLGLGIAVAGSVANTALYNGIYISYINCLVY